MPWDYATDPFYRALLAEIADLEWLVLEAEFQGALPSPSVVSAWLEQLS